METGGLMSASVTSKLSLLANIILHYEKEVSIMARKILTAIALTTTLTITGCATNQGEQQQAGMVIGNGGDYTNASVLLLRAGAIRTRVSTILWCRLKPMKLPADRVANTPSTR